MTDYVHGYSEREKERLFDQAGAVRELLHNDTGYPGGSLVLEAGCGVGAQTVTLARQSPGSFIVSIDISKDSIQEAREVTRREGFNNIHFQQADIYSLPFKDESFDHLFVCYVLEHLPEPKRALEALRRLVKIGGTITVIEGDHGSCYYHPETDAARRAWQCLVDVQSRLGGDSLIGRRLYPLLEQSGYKDIRISPRMVYVDRSCPISRDAFVKRTIAAMVEGVRTQAVEMGMIDPQFFDQGTSDLHHIAECDEGTFCYTFFKAFATRR